MRTKELLNKLKGIQTIESVVTLLDTDKDTAIYYIHRLRKKGFVKTKKLSDNKRVYNISFENSLGGTSYYEILNKNSPIKITTSNIHSIYGKTPSLEETLIYAIQSQKFRTLLASLALFKKIKDYTLLYKLAKQNNVQRQIGTLYDLSRKIMKTRKMTKKFKNNSLPNTNHKYKYIIPKLRSDDFKDIEKKWKVYLPFNKEDLEVYR